MQSLLEAQLAQPRRRRALLRACLALPAVLALGACGSAQPGLTALPTTTPAQEQPPTPPVATQALSGPPPTLPPSPAAQSPTSPATAPSPTSSVPVASPTSAPAAPSPVTTASPIQAAATQPACTGTRALTVGETEGPYFKAGSPLRTSLLEPGMPGTKLHLTGFVFNANCGPIANAKLDFWHANAQGQYDNAGYTLRGHQMTDSSGRYTLDTIVPGLYTGRTGHIHVKVQAPGGPLLTSQLYFPGEPTNGRDPLYQASLQMSVVDTASGKQATFDFVVATA